MSDLPVARIWLSRAGLAGCILMAAIVVSSAFLRLTTMGIGCEPWPQCYGRLEAPHATRNTEPVRKSAGSVTVTRLLHRVAAMLVSILAVLVLMLGLVRGVRSRANIALALSALVLTAMLAVIGRWSATLLVPAVGVANLLGGFCLLACFWMLHLNNVPRPGPSRPINKTAYAVAVVAVLVFVVQAASGALISVTYSAALCPSLWACGAAPDAAGHFGGGFDLLAALPTDASGKVIAPAAAAIVQATHRTAGALTALLIAALGGWLALSFAHRALGFGLLSLGLLEALIGILMATRDFPLLAAMAHNFLAATLVLIFVTLIWRNVPR